MGGNFRSLGDPSLLSAALMQHADVPLSCCKHGDLSVKVSGLILWYEDDRCPSKVFEAPQSLDVIL